MCDKEVAPFVLPWAPGTGFTSTALGGWSSEPPPLKSFHLRVSWRLAKTITQMVGPVPRGPLAMNVASHN